MLNTRVTPYGDATHIPVIAVDPDGKVKSVTSTAVDMSSKAEVDHTHERSAIPRWEKYRVTITAGGWVVGDEEAVAAEADQSQDVAIVTLPAKSFLHRVFIKSAVAMAGVDTALLTLLVTPTGTILNPTDYDLMAAVAATNIADLGAPAAGQLTHASEVLSARIAVTGDGKTVASLTAGGAFDIWLLLSVLP